MELKRNPKDKKALIIIFSSFKIYFNLRLSFGEITFSFYKMEKSLVCIQVPAGAGFERIVSYYGLSFLIALSFMLLVLLLRSHSQQILALAQQKDYKDVIKMTKQAIKSQIDKINSELSIYKPADMKITALVRKEWKMS